MKKESSYYSPYSVTKHSDSLPYNFTTKNNIEYRVAFIDAINVFKETVGGNRINNVYTIIIEKVTNYIEPLDFNVQLTIKQIVLDFFIGKSNSILYLCEEADSKGLKRHNAFNRWYLSSNEKDFLKKADAEIFPTDYDSTIYTSIIYHYENPNRELLEQSYREVVDALNK